MITSLLKKAAKFGWLLPGFILWASYPPMGEKTDVLFALAPLMWLSRHSLPLVSAKRWFASGVFFWVATLSWMPAIVKNGGPWPLVVLGWLVLAMYMAAYFAAYGWLAASCWSWVREGGYWRRLFVVIVAEPVLWCGLELIRSRLFGGFAWNQLGVVPANGGFGAPAGLGGVYLLSACVILINGTIAGIGERVMRQAPRYAGMETLLAFGVVFAVFWSARQVEVGGGRRVKVAMVQRNFPCVFKANEENPYEVYVRLIENVSELKPDIVVLSESAMCEFGPVDRKNAESFAQYVRKQTGAAALLAGGSRYSEGRTYNSAALYDAAEVQIYDKVHLVPFGEYIPGDKWITSLQSLVPVGSCTPGVPKLLKIPGGEWAGVAICFEDTDSSLVRNYARMGAKVLFFITNDSWFSYSIEAVQHSWQAVARALETGLPVVRVGNSGVTGTISPDGKTTWLVGSDGLPLVDQQGVMMDYVALSTRVTPYVVVGDWPLATTFSLLIMAIILVKYKNHHERRRYLSV